MANVTLISRSFPKTQFSLYSFNQFNDLLSSSTKLFSLLNFTSTQEAYVVHILSVFSFFLWSIKNIREVCRKKKQSFSFIFESWEISHQNNFQQRREKKKTFPMFVVRAQSLAKNYLNFKQNTLRNFEMRHRTVNQMKPTKLFHIKTNKKVQ